MLEQYIVFTVLERHNMDKAKDEPLNIHDFLVSVLVFLRTSDERNLKSGHKFRGSEGGICVSDSLWYSLKPI